MSKKNPYIFGQQGRSSYNTQDASTGFDQREGSVLGDLANESPIEEISPEFISEDAGNDAVINDEMLTCIARERICPSCSVKQEADDTRLRAMAELDNTRKRLVREKEEHIAYASEAVLSDIIPALDNLDLALEHARNMDACKDLVIGVDMTRKILLDSLKKHGLESIGVVGECFDPAMHEAVGMEAHPEIKDNDVCRLLSKGYKLKGRLLRPARVVVAKN